MSATQTAQAKAQAEAAAKAALAKKREAALEAKIEADRRAVPPGIGEIEEIIRARMEAERKPPVNLYKACWIESDDPAELENFKKRKYQYMAKDIEGRDVFLADSNYVLQMAQNDFKSIRFHFTSEF